MPMTDEERASLQGLFRDAVAQGIKAVRAEDEENLAKAKSGDGDKDEDKDKDRTDDPDREGFSLARWLLGG